MDGVSGINSSLDIAAGALAVHSAAIQVAAHNIANVSTTGFLPRHATFATGSHGTGVELESVRKQDLPLGRQSLAEDGDRSRATIKASGTELAREMPQLITTQRGFEANAATVRTADEMLGSLLNLIA